MSGAGYPCVVERLGGTRACHLTPICAKVLEEGLYCLVGVDKVVLIELLNVLLLNAVNDALYTYVGDSLLKVERLLKIFVFTWRRRSLRLGVLSSMAGLATGGLTRRAVKVTARGVTAA